MINECCQNNLIHKLSSVTIWYLSVAPVSLFAFFTLITHNHQSEAKFLGALCARNFNKGQLPTSSS